MAAAFSAFVDASHAFLMLQLLVAGVFVASAVGKLLDPKGFMRTLSSYRLLPPRLVGIVGRSLPYGQVAIASLLLWSPFTRGAALAAAAMLGSFLLAMSLALRSGTNTECGCFGLLWREPVGRKTLLREGVLLIGALLLVLLYPKTEPAWWMATPLLGGSIALSAFLTPWAVRAASTLSSVAATADRAPLLAGIGGTISRRRLLSYTAALIAGSIMATLPFAPKVALAWCPDPECGDCHLIDWGCIPFYCTDPYDKWEWWQCWNYCGELCADWTQIIECACPY